MYNLPIEIIIRMAATDLYKKKGLMRSKNISWGKEDCWVMHCDRLVSARLVNYVIQNKRVKK